VRRRIRGAILPPAPRFDLRRALEHALRLEHDCIVHERAIERERG
jgi:hypothetical protein